MTAWPWDVARRGGNLLAEHAGVTTAFASSGQRLAASTDGASLLASVACAPKDPAATNRVLDSGMFTAALDAVRADGLLRTVLIGWSLGAQVLIGGDGGTGVATDMLDRSCQSPVKWSAVNVGLGFKAGAKLVLGAMATRPHDLNASTAVAQIGANLAGVGAFVSVIMVGDDLDLIGFTLAVGPGAGLATSVGYGSISAG